MMKRVLFGLVAAVIVVAAGCSLDVEEPGGSPQPGQTPTGQPEPEGNFESIVFNEGVTIISYTGSATNLVIPGTIGGLPVTLIGDGAFQGKHLTGVTIPAGVIGIGDSAFADNELAVIVIPAGVLSIGNSAFSGNPLTRVTIPAGVAVTGILFPSFDGDFAAAYAAGGAGTYTCSGGTWTKGSQTPGGEGTPGGEEALPPEPETDFTVEDNATGVTITGYTGSAKAVGIPGTIGGKTVTAIGDAVYNEEDHTVSSFAEKELTAPLPSPAAWLPSANPRFNTTSWPA
jgi:hypothetical protein